MTGKHGMSRDWIETLSVESTSYDPGAEPGQPGGTRHSETRKQQSVAREHPASVDFSIPTVFRGRLHGQTYGQEAFDGSTVLRRYPPSPRRGPRLPDRRMRYPSVPLHGGGTGTDRLPARSTPQNGPYREGNSRRHRRDRAHTRTGDGTPSRLKDRRRSRFHISQVYPGVPYGPASTEGESESMPNELPGSGPATPTTNPSRIRSGW